MRAIHVDQMKPGGVLGRSLLDENGQVLLQEGVTLTEEYIRALRDKGHVTLYVRADDASVGDEPEPQEGLSPATRAKALQALQNVFESIERTVGRVKLESSRDVRKVCENSDLRALLSGQGPFAKVYSLIDRILDEVMTRSVLAGMTSLKSADTQIYQHSIDVCVMALMLARDLDIPSHHLRQLAAGCLMHDIGLLFIEKGLPEEARIRQHTLLGYEILKASPDQSILTPHVALEHHERQDGKGLPRGLYGSNTIARNRGQRSPIPTLIGEIAAVANAYDSLVTGTETTNRVAPDEAVQILRASGGTALNEEVVRAFLRIVPVYPKGSDVVVTDGKYRQYWGVVITVNPAHLDRPVVSLYRDGFGKTIEPVEIDMTKEHGMRIRVRGV